MIIKVNFLSKEYNTKLLTEKVAKMAGVAGVLLVLLEFGGSYYFDSIIKEKEAATATMVQKIDKLKADRAKLIAESKQIPDLSSKISILNDLFAQANLRFSEILYSLSKVTPGNVWYTSFNYSDNKVILKGNAFDELLIYTLERNLKEAGMYSEVKNDYIRDVEVNKQLVKEFQYTLLVNANAMPAYNAGLITTGAAVTNAAAVTQ